MSFLSPRRAQFATYLFFLSCGIGMSSWAPMVPYAKTRLGLDDGQLGLLLLALGGGAMITMPLTGVLINIFGSRRTMLGAVLVYSMALPFLSFVHDPLLMGLALFVFGAGIGAVDVSMNAQAVVVERKLARPVMSSFHGLYSVGGLLGAAGVTLLLNRGLDLFICSISVAVLCVLAGVSRYFWLLPKSEDDRITSGKFVLPRGPVILIGAMCFIGFLAEGALLDWSAVFLKFFRGVEESSAGLGFAAFSAAMVVGRLSGDYIASRVDPLKAVRYGALLAAVGYLVSVVLPWTAAAMIGYALIGLGMSNVVPLLFSAAGRLPYPPPSVSIPAITTMGYAGILVGPALIGFAAEKTSLPVSLGAVGILLVAVAFSVRFLRK